jgi:hypothetical protein
LLPCAEMTAHMGAIIIWTCIVYHVLYYKEIEPKKQDAMTWKFHPGKYSRIIYFGPKSKQIKIEDVHLS